MCKPSPTEFSGKKLLSNVTSHVGIKKSFIFEALPSLFAGERFHCSARMRVLLSSLPNVFS